MIRLQTSLPVCSVFLALVFVLGNWSSAEEVHIYLFGGQSNGTGRGDAVEIPNASPLGQVQTDVRFWYRKTETNATNNVLPENEIIDLAPGAGHGTVGEVAPVEFGPELGIGRALADGLPGQNVMIIKGTHAGSNLFYGWSAGGPRYECFQQTVGGAIDAIVANGDTPVMKGMFWVQGESDSTDLGRAMDYADNLADLVARVRMEFLNGQDAPFVLSQLSDNQFDPLGDGQIFVREGQAAVAAADAKVKMIVTDDDFLFTTRTDIVHFDANGLINLGTRMGQAMVELETLGDVNCDGIINLLDIEPFINLLATAQYSAKADLNQDGVVSLLDAGPFVELLTN